MKIWYNYLKIDDDYQGTRIKIVGEQNISKWKAQKLPFLCWNCQFFFLTLTQFKIFWRKSGERKYFRGGGEEMPPLVLPLVTQLRPCYGTVVYYYLSIYVFVIIPKKVVFWVVKVFCVFYIVVLPHFVKQYYFPFVDFSLRNLTIIDITRKYSMLCIKILKKQTFCFWWILPIPVQRNNYKVIQFPPTNIVYF